MTPKQADIIHRITATSRVLPANHVEKAQFTRLANQGFLRGDAAQGYVRTKEGLDALRIHNKARVS